MTEIRITYEKDNIEGAYTGLLSALQADPPLPGGPLGERTETGTMLTWAEVSARLIRDVLESLEEYREWKKKLGPIES